MSLKFPFHNNSLRTLKVYQKNSECLMGNHFENVGRWEILRMVIWGLIRKQVAMLRKTRMLAKNASLIPLGQLTWKIGPIYPS